LVLDFNRKCETLINTGWHLGVTPEVELEPTSRIARTVDILRQSNEFLTA
jgi:hypothetical protein